MKPEQTFRYLLKARNTLLWVVSGEERRAERAIASVAAADGYHVRYWDCATGASDVEGNKVELPGAEGLAGTVFHRIRSRETREVWILRDLSPWLQDPVICRGLKSLARDLQDEMEGDKLAAVVVLDPSPTVPETLQGSTVVLDWPLPTRSEIDRILDDVLRAARVDVNGERDRVVDAAVGLRADDIASAFAFSIVQHHTVDPAEVASQKKLIIDREPTLTWYEPEERGLDAIGGLDRLKGWLAERRLALTPEARAYGLPAPKGVLLVGVPGCGKSLTAKAVPTAWGALPLLRLDLGALRGSLVGQSEQNIRQALKVAEAVAPAVLWLDEIEKGLAGAEGRGDGGVAADQLGTILTWLNERQGSVFVVATANDVTALPPELSRKGRFDEVFFVDLPTPLEREAVVSTTLLRYKRDPADFDLAAVATTTDGFSGAELAELVPSALFTCFREDARDLKTSDLIDAAKQIVPMSRSAAERIKALRQWAEGRARRASTLTPSSTQTLQAGSGYGRALDLETTPKEATG